MFIIFKKFKILKKCSDARNLKKMDKLEKMKKKLNEKDEEFFMILPNKKNNDITKIKIPINIFKKILNF